MTTSFFDKHAQVHGIKYIILLLVMFPSLLFGQAKRPTGKEIASVAKKYRELKQFKKTDVINGKKLSFTPVELIDSTGLGDGFLLGVLENEAPGGETGLPPGRYNLFFNEINGKPHVYAEANGVIVKEASRVSVDKAKDQSEKNPKISFKASDGYKMAFMQYGWGLTYYSGYVSVVTTSTSGTTTSNSYPCSFCFYRVYF